MTVSVLINRRAFEPFLCLDLVFFLVTARQTFQCHEDFAAFLCCAGSAELLFWGPQRSQRHDFDTFLCCAGSTVLFWGPQCSQCHEFDTSCVVLILQCCFGVLSILRVVKMLLFPVLCCFCRVVVFLSLIHI